MLDSILAIETTESFTMSNILIILLSALGLGFITSCIYLLTHKKEGYSPSYIVTLTMLPGIIAMIILLIGNNVARAFSLAGAFSLIRFRSEPGDPKDIAYVFLTLAIGLACGMGYIVYSIIFLIIMGLALILFYKLNFPKEKINSLIIKITIPEDVNYNGLFDDIFEKYCSSYLFKKVKTVDFGSFFEVSYLITFKPNTDSKNFLDELRCRNNNLNIIISASEN